MSRTLYAALSSRLGADSLARIRSLSSEGKDFIAMFRLGQLQEVKWAGNPYANKTEGGADYNPLEPRRSFKTWSEMVVGRCRAWTDEQMEVAGVLALVYGESRGVGADAGSSS